MLFRAIPAKSALALLSLLALASAGNAETYKLGPQDKVKVKVVEWRDNMGEYFEWATLTGDYSVNVSGKISLPLVGDVSAAGLSTDELATAISSRLQARVGLMKTPDTSVEVVSYRPFFILGNVEKPGEYAYRPGMNVLQAMSVAGGLLRPKNLDEWRLGREALSTRGELRVHNVTISSLLARQARLSAELQKKDTIAFPAELLEQKTNSLVANVMREEQMILRARADSTRTQLQSLNQQKVLLEKEIESLQSQIEIEANQLKAIQRELANISTLVEKGLARAPQLLALERAVAQVEGDRLEKQTAVLRARQDINKTERSMSEIELQRQYTILAELQSTETKLAELSEKVSTAERLIYEVEVAAPQIRADQARSQVQPVYSIVRGTGDKVEEKVVSETEAVQPGDTVKVLLPLPTPVGTISDATHADPSPAPSLAMRELSQDTSRTRSR